MGDERFNKQTLYFRVVEKNIFKKFYKWLFKKYKWQKIGKAKSLED